jgi:hypothetical protein
MHEDRRFSGQPILVLNPSSEINFANRMHQSNRHYKKLSLRTHLITLLYGVFTYSSGLREIGEGVLEYEGKLTLAIKC